MSPDTDADGNYDHGVDCLWTIVAPEGRLIEVDVTQMDIFPTRVCFSDFLAVMCLFERGYNSEKKENKYRLILQDYQFYHYID